VRGNLRSLIVWILVAIVAILIFRVFEQAGSRPEEIHFSAFMNEVDAGKIKSVQIKEQEITGRYLSSTRPKDAPDFITYVPPVYDDLVAALRKNHVEIEIIQAKESTWLTFLFSWGPILFLVALWVVFMRQMQSGGNKALSFGKSRARVLTPNQLKVTFADVAGVEEAKEELQEIIEFLKDPKKFQRLGGKIPKGVILMGPPGTGKTLLGKAIAGEAGVPFISFSGSEFVEMFVGVGASRVRDLFELGKRNAPSIIFVDEIDAVGRHRGAGLGGGHDEREQTLNQLLVEMDGFETNEGVIIMAATNRPDVLDPALLRPGRFDRRIVVDRPDLKGRHGILKVHVRKVPLCENVDLEVVARTTPGFSGADLANLVNEAALIAARNNKSCVAMEDFEYAKDKVLMGAERKSLIISDKEKKSTAVHEAGHALVAAMLSETDPLHKVTIIPRGRALGVTMQLPMDDRYNYTKSYLQDQITMMLGGRIAEEEMLEQLSTGAGNDLERATELARKMVCAWGMSDLGPITFGQGDENIFLGKELIRHQNYSEDTAKKIDEEVYKIIHNAYQIATDLIRTHRQVLEAISTTLLEKEVLEGEHVYAIIHEITGLDLRRSPADPLN